MHTYACMIYEKGRNIHMAGVWSTLGYIMKNQRKNTKKKPKMLSVGHSNIRGECTKCWSKEHNHLTFDFLVVFFFWILHIAAKLNPFRIFSAPFVA